MAVGRAVVAATVAVLLLAGCDTLGPAAAPPPATPDEARQATLDTFTSPKRWEVAFDILVDPDEARAFGDAIGQPDVAAGTFVPAHVAPFPEGFVVGGAFAADDSVQLWGEFAGEPLIDVRARSDLSGSPFTFTDVPDDPVHAEVHLRFSVATFGRMMGTVYLADLGPDAAADEAVNNARTWLATANLPGPVEAAAEALLAGDWAGVTGDIDPAWIADALENYTDDPPVDVVAGWADALVGAMTFGDVTVDGQSATVTVDLDLEALEGSAAEPVLRWWAGPSLPLEGTLTEVARLTFEGRHLVSIDLDLLAIVMADPGFAVGADPADLARATDLLDRTRMLARFTFTDHDDVATVTDVPSTTLDWQTVVDTFAPTP